MDFPFPKSNIEKLHTYKPNFGKSKITNLIRLSANESALGASLNAINALKNFSSELMIFTCCALSSSLFISQNSLNESCKLFFDI